MGYESILDFENQTIVDEIYKRLKTDEENIELEEAYKAISDRNKSKHQVKNILFTIKKLGFFIDRLFDIFNSLIVALMFFLGGAFIISIFSLFFVYSFNIDGFKESMNNIGTNIISKIIALDNAIITDMLTTNNDVGYIIGFTSVLFVCFVLLYILSMFKKKKKKEYIINGDKEDLEGKKDYVIIDLDKVYYYLKVSDNDTWDYVKSSLAKRVKKVANRSLHDMYYACYIYFAKYYNEVETDFNALTNKQKVLMTYHTIKNVIINVVGLLGKPFIALVLLIVFYYRFFGVGLLLMIEHENPFQNGAIACYSFLQKVDAFVSTTPLSTITHIFSGETRVSFIPEDIYQYLVSTGGEDLRYFISLVVLVLTITIIYNFIFKRLSEIKCQYNRRLTYYTKINMNMYDEKTKFKSDNLYIFDFTLVIFIVLFMYLLVNL